MRSELARAAVLTLVALTLLSTFDIHPAFAAPLSIHFDPSSIAYDTGNATIGTLFNVTVVAENVPATPSAFDPTIAGASAWQVYVGFNDSNINVTSWYEPTIDPTYIFFEKITSALPSPPNPGYFHVGPGSGRIQVAGNLFPTPPAQNGSSGPGPFKLCILTFNITKLPDDSSGPLSSALHFSPADTFLLDTDGNEMPATLEDGHYEISDGPPISYTLTIGATTGGTTNPAPGSYMYNQGENVAVGAINSTGYKFDSWRLDGSFFGSSNPVTVTMDGNHTLLAMFTTDGGEIPRMFVDPAGIMDPSLIPCVSNFGINITLDDIANMKECEFNLTYDYHVISFTGLDFFRVGGQYPNASIDADNTAGFAWIKLTYDDAKTVTDPTALVTMRFHVNNYGSTPLNLTDTKIKDPVGGLISHSVYHGFFATLLRDVGIINIALSRTWAYQGWPVSVTVTIKNKGNATETFDLHTYYDSSLIGTHTVTDLVPDEVRDVVFDWDTTGVEEGNYTIEAQADPVPFEFNLADNTLVDGQVWIMTKIHDVAIVTATLLESWVYQGCDARLNVTVQNLGFFGENFDIRVYRNSTLLLGTFHVFDLLPFQSLEAQLILNTSDLLPCHTYEISVEATEIPYDYNVTNNFLADGDLKIRWLGDVNGDGKVDVKDVYIVSQAYGTIPGMPRWNPIADLNQDMKVDVKDVYIVSKNYGKGCYT